MTTKSSKSSTASSRYSANKTLQNSNSYESCDSGLDSLPRDFRDRLMVNESGLSSVSSSNSSCSSPAPSETPSDMSRISSGMEYDSCSRVSNAASQKSDVSFNAKTSGGYTAPSMPRVQSPDSQSNVSASSSRSNISTAGNFGGVQRSCVPPAVRIPIFKAGCSSSDDATVTVEEKDGRRTVTSEKSNVIREDGGIMEAREITAESDEKDGRSARKEALTRIQREYDDPEGRYKGAEKGHAAEVNESCVKQLGDGSTMSIKKKSSSTSSSKTFVGGDVMGSAFNDPFFSMGFPPDFGDLRSLTGRGQSLMSQMSSDSAASTLSGQSQAANRGVSTNMADSASSAMRSSQSMTSSQSQSSRSMNRSSFSGGDEFDRDPFSFSRGSLLANRPSLFERSPEFSSALAEFDNFPRSSVDDFFNSNSSFSRSSRLSNNSSFSSNSSEFPFNRKF